MRFSAQHHQIFFRDNGDQVEISRVLGGAYHLPLLLIPWTLMAVPTRAQHFGIWGATG
jgi:hypothetical protein